MFENLNITELKKLYNQGIDTILADNGFTVPCLFKYETTKRDLCHNCHFSSVTNSSSNRYNNTGPISFPDGTTCPICRGFGYIDTSSDETIYLAILFDSKYWLNWDSKSMRISDGMVQSLSKIDILPKIKNCKEIIVDTTLSNYDNYIYKLAGEPQPVGLGSNDYIISMWKRS